MPTDEPRIAPLRPQDWPEQMRAALADLVPPRPRHPLPERTEGRPKGLNALGMFAHHPELAAAFNRFNGHILFATTLSTRQRELVVLRVAAIRGSEYEWAQHAILAADAGITVEEVRRVADEPQSEQWLELERAMIQAVDELLADAKIADDTWALLAAELDVRQLLDLMFTVGAYDVIAMAFRSCGVQLDADLGGVAGSP